MRTAIIVLAVTVFSVAGASARSDQQRRIIPTSVSSMAPERARGTVTLFFDDMESGENGWTTVDNTAAQAGTSYFHVDTYMAYQGDYSWWCGTFDYDADGGYGNDWSEALCIPPTDVSGASYPVLTYVYRNDSELGYDFTYVQAESAGAYISLQEGYDGVVPWTDIGTGHILSNYDNPATLRFLFNSDPTWSDEDGLYLTNGGAFMVDNVKIYDYFGGYIYFYDDVESGGLCFPGLVPASGDWWHIIDRACPAYSDSHSWWCGDDADTSLIPPNLNNSLISPWVDVSGVTTCTLKFAMHIAIPTVDNDYVLISATNDGEDYVSIIAYWGDFESCDGWGQTALRGFDLAHDTHGLFPADSIRVKFTMFTTDNGCGPGGAGDAGVMIDDVCIESWGASVTWDVPGDASTIQAAIDMASQSDVVRVAPGTYSPSTNGESFPIVMKNRVALESSGGPEVTILDAEGTGGVLSCTGVGEFTEISGFTITGGPATDGGGVYCSSSSPYIMSCLTAGNSATNGGGVYCDAGSEPYLYRCTLFENEADVGSGIASVGGSDPDLYQVIIADGAPGEAVYCGGGSGVNVSYSNIHGNAGGDWLGCLAGQLGQSGNISAEPGFCDPAAGDLYICSGSPCFMGMGHYMGAFPVGCISRTWQVTLDAPTIQAAMDSARAYDTVVVEAGTYYEHDITVRSAVSLESETREADCVVIDAGGLGRVFDFDGAAAQTEVEGFTLTGGSADHGAGMRLVGSSPVIASCAIVGNTASASGGGALCSNGSSPQFLGCTFFDNAAPGAAIVCATGSGPSFSEAIVAFSTTGSAVICDGTSSATFSDSDIYGNTGGNWTDSIATQLGSDGNIEALPGFCDADASDLHLCSASPCVLGGGAHMGAFPVGCTTVTWQVPSEAPSIAAAIDSARAYDAVIIDCGTYYEHDVVLKPGVSLESATGEADCVVIDAGGLGRVMDMDSVPSQTSVEGLTLTGGSAPEGGALRLTGSSPTVLSCIVSGNTATVSGGGVSCSEGSEPEFTGCTFSGNAAPDATIASKTSSGPSFANTILAFGASGAAVSCDGTSGATLACSDVYGNAGGDWTGCIASQAGSNGNFEEDPEFVDAPGGDFHLLWTSPCIDADGCGLVGALGPIVTPEPNVAGIADVPDDEGGSVSISWSRSEHDGAQEPPVVEAYDVYRRQESRLDGWDLVGTFPATQEWVYEASVPTLCDSTPAGGICWSTFFVMATTASPETHFDSQPDSGYSVDNLPPAPPENLSAVGDTVQIILTWDPNDEPDLHQYAVYRDTVMIFEPGVPIGYAPAAYFEDNDPPEADNWWYVVTAWDVNGNESDPSDPDGISTGIDGLGPRLRLTHAVPNPFNPQTVISYELPEPGTVSLRVFDASGKLVRALVDGRWETGGVHHVSWDGRDNEGGMLPSGVYFYRLEVGGEVLTKRMVLLK